MNDVAKHYESKLVKAFAKVSAILDAMSDRFVNAPESLRASEHKVISPLTLPSPSPPTLFLTLALSCFSNVRDAAVIVCSHDHVQSRHGEFY